MAYLVFLFTLCFIAGLVGVASNPSPHFGALGLVVCVLGGCGVLVGLGGSFLGLVLFLIYLGGMLVVFAYSVALAAEAYPEAWGGSNVLGYVVGYVVFVFFVLYMAGAGFGGHSWGVLDGGGLFNLRVDFSGAVLLFLEGGIMLLLCGGGLLLALIAVFELVRGRGYGALRVP